MSAAIICDSDIQDLMKRSIVLLIGVLNLTQCSSPYLNNRPLTERETEKDQRNHHCITTTKYTAVERMKFYPFNTSAVIKFVSFDNPEGEVEDTLPMNGKEIDYTKITEEKTLSKEQIDELTSILYNVTYKGEIFLVHETGCYNPKNAILFCDKNNNLLEFIEICFHCGGYELSSEKIGLGDLCNQKWDMIRSFFLTAGIKIGIIREVLER